MILHSVVPKLWLCRHLTKRLQKLIVSTVVSVKIFCPTGAISIRHNREAVWEALADPDTRVIAQVAPAVRVAVGGAFGLPEGQERDGQDCQCASPHGI